jgi:hypothetical protein
MVRTAVTIFLLSAFAIQTFDKVFIIADYYLNTASFRQLCENRARPKMNCNGKCLLMKKISEQEKKEQKNTELKLENKNEVFFFPKYEVSHKNYEPEFQEKPTIPVMGPVTDRSLSVFRPPASLS